MPRRLPRSRRTRLLLVLAAVASLAGVLAMHGLTPTHDLMALRQLPDPASPAAMSTHLETTPDSHATLDLAGNRTAVEMPSPASASDRLVVSPGRDTAREAAQRYAALMNDAMSHGATTACLAILGASVLMALLRRRGASWPTSATLNATGTALAGNAAAPPQLRCRAAPSHLELCVWRT